MYLNKEAELKEFQEKLKQELASWTAGRSKIYFLTPAEQKKRLGCIPGPDEPSFEERERLGNQNQPEGELPVSVFYPTYKNWAISCFGNTCGDAILAGDQGSCGSCVAFATAGTLLMRAQIDLDQWLDYLPNGDKKQTVVSSAYLFYCIAAAQGRNCSDGWWITAAANAVVSGGAPDANYFLYTPGNQPCNVQSPWKGWKAASTKTLSNTSDMKQYIASKGPLSTSFSVYSDFYGYKNGVYKKSSGATYKGGHAVCVVGYDDSKQAWHCVNSWGWDWGEYGFFWIGYGQCGIDTSMVTLDGITNKTS